MERNYPDYSKLLRYNNSVRIEGFRDAFRFLSNFWFAPIIYDGYKWTSTECAYQAYKTLDLELREEFKGLTSSECKRKGNNIIIRDDWNLVKDQIMYDLVCAKFLQNEDLGNMLIATADAYIEETNWWNDTYWGVCNGKGENRLGKILMLVREMLNADRARS